METGAKYGGILMNIRSSGWFEHIASYEGPKSDRK